MCAGSAAKIRGKDVSVYMGYYGGSMTVDEFTYKVGDRTEGSREELIEKLCKYKKAELAELFADLIENAEE